MCSFWAAGPAPDTRQTGRKLEVNTTLKAKEWREQSEQEPSGRGGEPERSSSWTPRRGRVSGRRKWKLSKGTEKSWQPSANCALGPAVLQLPPSLTPAPAGSWLTLSLLPDPTCWLTVPVLQRLAPSHVLLLPSLTLRLPSITHSHNQCSIFLFVYISLRNIYSLLKNSLFL